MTFDDDIERVQEMEEAKKGHQEYRGEEFLCSSQRYFDEMKLFFEENEMNTATLVEQQSLAFSSTSQNKTKITFFSVNDDFFEFTLSILTI